jgi:hypothetical protein
VESPVFPLADRELGERWRTTVQKGWDWLQQHSPTTTVHCQNYFWVMTEDRLGTNELKRIARAILHFEPAFVDLVPRHRPRNPSVKANVRQGLSDPHERIEAATSRDQIVELMHCPWPPEPPAGERDPNYFRPKRDDRAHFQRWDHLDPDFLWNFTSLVHNSSEIEFRGAAACTTGRETLAWAELAISFFNAALQTPSDDLESFTKGHGGLWAFLKPRFVPGFNQPERMTPLWEAARSRPGSASKIMSGRRDLGF